MNKRLNMTSNLKLILSAVGVAALLASPAMAKAHARNHAAAIKTLQNVPADTRAESYTPSTGWTQKVYSAEAPVPAHHGSINPDFQLGGDR
jgi:hypothetical protein